MQENKPIKKILTNFSYNLSYQIFSIILPFLSIPYLTKVISQDLIGINTIANATCAYFVLFGILGVNTYGSREIAKYQQNTERRSVVFFQIYAVQLTSHTLFLSLYIIYSFLFSNIEYRGITLLYTIYIISSAFDISWLYSGVENFKDVSIRNMFVKLASFSCLFIFVKSDQDIYKYILTIYIPQILVNIYMWLKARKIVDFKYIKNIIGIKREHLKGSLSLFFPQIASSIYTILDKTILGMFAAYSVVATYEQAQALLRLFLAIVPSFSKVMMPRMANSIYEQDQQGTEKLLLFSSKFVWGISFLMFFGVLSCSDYFVAWYLPISYSDATYIINVCSPIIIAVSGANLISIQVLIPLGEQNKYTKSIITASIINITLNFILVPWLGVIGICIASVIAEVVGFGMQVYYVRRYFQLKRIFCMVPVFFISGAMMLIINMFIKHFLNPSFLSVVILAVSGCIVYFLIVYALLHVKQKLLKIKVKE